MTEIDLETADLRETRSRSQLRRRLQEMIRDLDKIQANGQVKAHLKVRLHLESAREHLYNALFKTNGFGEKEGS